ncbi:unnamed protein product [Musa banksii]
MRPAYRIISVKIGAGGVVDCMNVTFTYYGGTSHEIVLEEDEHVVGMEGEVATYHGPVIEATDEGWAVHLHSTPTSQPWRSAISSLSPSSPASSFCRRKGGVWCTQHDERSDQGGSMGRERRVGLRHGTCLSYHQRQDFSGDVVDAVDVTFTYYGKTETRHFGGGGGTPHEIVLQEGEYLVGMAGEVANYHGVVVVGKLGFSTNKKAYGPFGNAGGTPSPSLSQQARSQASSAATASFLTPLGSTWRHNWTLQ